MQSPATTKKERTIESLAICIFQMEVTKGHLKWKVTELESKAKVSRSLIYRYLGSTKPEILKSAIEIFTANFYGFTPKENPPPLADRVRITRQFLTEVPEAILFYQKWREKETWVSKELQRAEEKFQRKLAKFYPELRADQVLILHGCLHGLVTAPFLTADQAAAGTRELERTLLPGFSR